MLPVGAPGLAPENPVRRRPLYRIPFQVRIVAGRRSRDQRLIAVAQDARRRGRQRERRGGGRVDARVLSEIRQRDAFVGIAHVVLASEVLPRLPEADGGKSELVVRRVVSTAA